MEYFKKYSKIFLIPLTLLFVFIGLYLSCSIVFTIIPVNPDFKEPESGIEIYIRSNGVHTDVIVPVKTTEKDWTEKIKVEDFKPNVQSFKYISFGWGDKGFYLNTPTWAELKFSTAFNAMFLGGATAMHVGYETQTPVLNQYTRSVKVSPEQYAKLVNYIESSFQTDEYGNYRVIKGYHYSRVNDNFYDAKGSYYFFRTCNTWTNSALKETGVKTALWAPFDESVLFYLKRKDKW
jgi:uncharacterized protein (TIGR02117 family)